MAGQIQLTLERDGHDQPWGFRLQGGHDVGLPLSIQRVLVGTPAEGVLKKGDVLMRISQTDAKGLSHQMAADLFTNAGNQIQIVIKRQSAASASTGNASNIPSPKPVAISGGVPLQGMTSTSPVRSPETLVLNLPQSRSSTQPFCAASHQASSSAPLSPLSLTIQNQPYRTSPLIQPSAKVDVGPGSVQHLRMQADHITGVRDALPEPNTLQYKANEFAMKQKVTGTLQHIQQTPFAPSISPPLTEPIAATSSPVPQPMSSPPVRPPKQYYNNPINLYSSENVAEIVRLNKMGVSGAPREVFPASPSSPTGLVNPVNKPPKSFLGRGGLPKKYDPEQSATWQAIHEQEKCQLITEHKARNSKVYSV